MELVEVNLKGMRMLNIGLFRLLFSLIIALWFKCIWDITHAYEVWPNTTFPDWFNILFIGASVVVTIASFWLTSKLERIETQTGSLDYLLWILIPVSLLCVLPVCYRGSIFYSRYEISTFLRWILLVSPVFIGGIFFLTKYKSQAVTLLLVLGFIALIPNDGCKNQFNYWYVKYIGYSPLMYVPVVANILFAVSAYFGKNKRLLVILSLGVCVGCLIIRFGHRFKILW